MGIGLAVFGDVPRPMEQNRNALLGLVGRAWRSVEGRHWQAVCGRQLVAASEQLQALCNGGTRRQAVVDVALAVVG